MEEEALEAYTKEQRREDACSIRVYLRVRPSSPCDADVSVRTKEKNDLSQERQDVR